MEPGFSAMMYSELRGKRHKLNQKRFTPVIGENFFLHVTSQLFFSMWSRPPRDAVLGYFPDPDG